MWYVLVKSKREREGTLFLSDAAAVPYNLPFSPDELQIMNYYAAEVAKVVGQLEKV